MTTHTIPAAWLREGYPGTFHAKVKVHENSNGEFFDHVVFKWTTPVFGANTHFALIAKSTSGDSPFLFATASVISARLYDDAPPVIEFATGDLLDIESVGRFTIEPGGSMSYGVKLTAAADCPCCDGAYNGLDH